MSTLTEQPAKQLSDDEMRPLRLRLSKEASEHVIAAMKCIAKLTLEDNYPVTLGNGGFPKYIEASNHLAAALHSLFC